MLSIPVHDLSGTEALGRQLGSLLFPGAVLALNGQLGAGKTHLTRAIAEGLDVANPLAVTSPTFVLIQEYPARLPIYHFDAYRLKDWHEFADLGVQEYFQSDGVCIVEWAERVHAAMPLDHLDIRIQIVTETQRRFEITATGPLHEHILQTLHEKFSSLC